MNTQVNPPRQAALWDGRFESPAADSALAQRTWVLLTESPEGGWGIAGHANTQADIAAAARAALSARD